PVAWMSEPQAGAGEGGTGVPIRVEADGVPDATIAIATRTGKTASERLAFIPSPGKRPARLIRARDSANRRPSHSAGRYRRSRDFDRASDATGPSLTVAGQHCLRRQSLQAGPRLHGIRPAPVDQAS